MCIYSYAYAQKYEFRHENMAYENVQFRPPRVQRIDRIEEAGGIVFGMTIYRFLSYTGESPLHCDPRTWNLNCMWATKPWLTNSGHIQLKRRLSICHNK